jgi:hypothetical protein
MAGPPSEERPVCPLDVRNVSWLKGFEQVTAMERRTSIGEEVTPPTSTVSGITVPCRGYQEFIRPMSTERELRESTRTRTSRRKCIHLIRPRTKGWRSIRLKIACGEEGLGLLTVITQELV